MTRIIVAEMVEARNLACLDLIMEDDFDELLNVLYAARSLVQKERLSRAIDDAVFNRLDNYVALFDFDTEARP